MNFRGLALCILALGLLIAALVARSGTLALLSIPFFAYVAVGLWGAPADSLRLEADRSVEVLPEGDSTAVRVRVTVRGGGDPVPALRIADTLPDGAALVSGSPVKRGGLLSGATLRVEYLFRAPRGVFRWKTVHAVASDPFRLFEREQDLPAEAETVIRPRVKRFRPFALHPERTLHSPGSVLGGRAGSGTDFWGVREYQPGDPMRHLDWRRAARYPGQLFTREQEQEEIADVGLVLDARVQANLCVGDRELLDGSLDAAASLSEMFLRGGNRVGLVLLENAVKVVYPGYGKVQLNRLLRVLAAVRPAWEASRTSLDHVPLRVFSTRALIVILSPLTSGEWQLFPRLCARGNEGLLISPDPVDFMKGTAADEMSRLARRVARVERRLDLRRVTQLGIRVVDWKPGTPLAPLVHRALQPSRGRTG